MNWTKPYWGILFLALIATFFLLGLAFIFKDATELAVLFTLAAVLIGAFGGVALQIIGPPPDPEVPASAVRDFLAFLGGRDPGPMEARCRSEVPVNVLGLAILGALIVLVLAIVFKEVVGPVVIFTVAGVLIGWIATAMKGMVAPPPDPTVPASVVRDFMEQRAALPAEQG